MFFANYTSSLLAVNSTLLAYGLALVAALGAVALVFYFLSSQQSSGYSSYNNQYRGFRSEQGNYNIPRYIILLFSKAPYKYMSLAPMYQNVHPYPQILHSSVSGGTGYDILTLIGVATDIYSKLSYDDTDCQKKIICEFMEEPDMFGKPWIKSG